MANEILTQGYEIMSMIRIGICQRVWASFRHPPSALTVPQRSKADEDQLIQELKKITGILPMILMAAITSSPQHDAYRIQGVYFSQDTLQEVVGRRPAADQWPAADARAI